MFALQILVSTPARRRALTGSAVAAAALLAGCGQKGPLFLPTGEAAAGRATLPQTLSPAAAVAPAAGASAPGAPNTGAGAGNPPTGTAAPVRNP